MADCSRSDLDSARISRSRAAVVVVVQVLVVVLLIVVVVAVVVAVVAAAALLVLVVAVPQAWPESPLLVSWIFFFVVDMNV